MSEEKRKVLEMLAEGKITAQEAEQLLQAMDEPQPKPEAKAEPRYFRILVNKAGAEGKKQENVNIRVPISVVRGGLRLTALFPEMLGNKKIRLENGIEVDLSKIQYSDLEAMIKDIGEIAVDVDGGDAQVKIRCE